MLNRNEDDILERTNVYCQVRIKERKR